MDCHFRRARGNVDGGLPQEADYQNELSPLGHRHSSLRHLSGRFLVNLKMTKNRVLSFLTLGLAVHFAAIVAIPTVKDVTGPFNALGKSFPLLQDRGLLQRRDLLPTGTCNAETPCPIAACCGTNGLCGYSPAECGAGNCTSKCDSKAECGQYGTPGQQNCPLNVCCSEFGYVDR